MRPATKGLPERPSAPWPAVAGDAAFGVVAGADGGVAFEVVDPKPPKDGVAAGAV